TTIYSLADRGWSQRRIASGVGDQSRNGTRYLRLAKPAISITGSEEPPRSTGKLHGVPDLPPHYLTRQADVADLKQMLFAGGANHTCCLRHGNRSARLKD